MTTSTGILRLDRESRIWVIECAPHVSLRLRRVFGRLAEGAGGTHFLGDTLENATDLLWFLQRYPMESNEHDYLRAQAGAHAERTSAVRGLVSARLAPPEFNLAIPPRRYQSIGAAAAIESGGILIGDDVGLGKTITAIAAISDARMRPAVIVTLPHLTQQWVDELARFAPDLVVHAVRSDKPYELCAPRAGATSTWPDVVVLSYGRLSSWAPTLATRVRGVVFDEVHELRHPGTAKYSGATQLARASAVRLGLSATPIYNLGAEIHPVLEVLRPGELGTFDEFCREWCGSAVRNAELLNPDAFGAYARDEGLLLRRTRADVGREVPALTRSVQSAELDDEEFEAASAACLPLARSLVTSDGDEATHSALAHEFTTRLRRATGVAKAPFVAAFVRSLVESGEPVVVFGWHREVFARWRRALIDLTPELYTGAETNAEKQVSRARFLSGESKLLLMSLRSGAGLDGLQRACRTVVFGELDWSPGALEQCEGRVARDGQRDPVVAYYPLAMRGTDVLMADVIARKRAQVDGLRGAVSGAGTQLGADAVRTLALEFLARREARTAQAVREGRAA